MTTQPTAVQISGRVNQDELNDLVRRNVPEDVQAGIDLAISSLPAEQIQYTVVTSTEGTIDVWQT